MTSIERAWGGALALILALAAGGCTAAAYTTRAQVVAPVMLPLAGPAADRGTELSGLTWHGDDLILLPEVPNRFAPGDTLGLFLLPRAEIEAAVAAPGERSLVPRLLPCLAPGLREDIEGFDGLEAIVTVGDRAFVAVEAKPAAGMAGYLVGGRFDAVDGVVRFDATHRADIPLGVNLFNVSAEALVAAGDRVIAIVEANGANVRPQPTAPVFTLDLEPAGSLRLPQIEYRVTDATGLDAEGRFWVINYFYPPDAAKLIPAPDPEVAHHGAPPWSPPRSGFERLLELQLTADGRVVRTATPPLWLAPAADAELRNWEGVVRLGEEGFLLATDRYPATLLAYVPRPAAP